MIEIIILLITFKKNKKTPSMFPDLYTTRWCLPRAKQQAMKPTRPATTPRYIPFDLVFCKKNIF
jgi:hypothetical protein